MPDGAAGADGTSDSVHLNITHISYIRPSTSVIRSFHRHSYVGWITVFDGHFGVALISFCL